jgi:hypothetical protein
VRTTRVVVREGLVALALRRAWIVTPRLPILILIAVGTVARCWGSLDQLWLDEVWTLHLVHGVRSPIELLTRVTHDNNHILNSLYIWLVGVSAPSVILRLPTVALSVGSLLLVQRLTRERPAGERVVGTALIALSFPLIVYGSEARGYAGATFFALAAVVLLDRVHGQGSLGALALFWGMIVLGGLSHPTFLLIVPGLAVTALWSATRGRSWRAGACEMTRVVAVPLLVLTGLYWPRILHQMVGGVGGLTEFTALRAFREWLAILVGAPRTGPWAWPLALLILMILGIEISLERREGEREWLFRSSLIAVPLAVVTMVRPSFLFLRYFLVTVPFLLLVLARLLQRLFQRAPTLAAILVLAVLAGNARDTARFLEIGRGHYAEVVAYIGRHSVAQTSVSSDQDSRTIMLLGYYLPRVRLRQRVDYYPLMEIPAGGTDWLITHTFDRDPTPPLIEHRGSWAYRLVYHAPYFGELSGSHWFLYQKVVRGGGAGEHAVTR